ncbi:MAG TPA: DNA helicase RecG, partial [Ruminococcaceae bacterium]|nr:DNA helicase RecG [Oscillospiraceae bacterium]
MEITYLKGVGPRRAELYAKLGITTTEQLLRLYPRDYIDFTHPAKIRELQAGESGVFRAVVDRKSAPFSQYAKMAVYKALLTDGEGEITAVFFNTKFTFDKLELYKEYLFYGRISGDLMGLQVNSPIFLPVDKTGLLAKYPLTAGLSRDIVSKNISSALEIIKVPERLPESVVKKYSLLSADDAIRKIHFPKLRDEYQAARKRLVFEELLSLKLGLSRLKTRGRSLSGAVMSEVSLSEFYRSLPFEPTNAQLRAISDCIADMKRIYPMNRLVQGDVGSGKTLVAAAAAFFAQRNGFQTSVMAPTEVLAAQHYETFRAFLEPLGIRAALLSGALSAAEKKRVRAAAASGEIDVLIGTQALIQRSSAMKRLGLAIVDEQHRFGVYQRSELAEKGANPHILAMSATPIPRTLALIMYGDLDVS